MSSELVKRNERLEGIFNRASKEYDSIGPRYFSYFGEKLVQHTKIFSGATILDVACGRGASLFPSVHSVGENGNVIGIDFSEGMVKETQLLIFKQGLCNAKVIQMDAEKLEFPDNSFDYVLCGLSTSFFSNSIRVISEINRVLIKGGKLGLSTWKNRDRNGVLGKAYIKLFPQNQPMSINSTTGRPDFGSVEGINNILNGAGFKNIEIILENRVFYYRDEEEWWQEQWTNASRGLFEHIDSIGTDTLKRFKEAAFIEIMEYKDSLGIRFEAEVLFSFGNK